MNASSANESTVYSEHLNFANYSYIGLIVSISTTIPLLVAVVLFCWLYLHQKSRNKPDQSQYMRSKQSADESNARMQKLLHMSKTQPAQANKSDGHARLCVQFSVSENPVSMQTSKAIVDEAKLKASPEQSTMGLSEHQSQEADVARIAAMTQEAAVARIAVMTEEGSIIPHKGMVGETPLNAMFKNHLMNSSVAADRSTAHRPRKPSLVAYPYLLPEFTFRDRKQSSYRGGDASSATDLSLPISTAEVEEGVTAVSEGRL